MSKDVPWPKNVVSTAVRLEPIDEEGRKDVVRIFKEFFDEHLIDNEVDEDFISANMQVNTAVFSPAFLKAFDRHETKECIIYIDKNVDEHGRRYMMMLEGNRVAIIRLDY